MADERDQGRDGPVYATTKHTRLSLDEIGGMMPGLGTLMPVIADRFGWMVHAGRGGNWKLARYQLRKVRKLFVQATVTRPRWTETIEEYDAAYLAPIAAAIDASDPGTFEPTVEAAVEAANRIHGEIGYGYILYRVPDVPPTHMELGPVEEDGVRGADPTTAATTRPEEPDAEEPDGGESDGGTPDDGETGPDATSER